MHAACAWRRIDFFRACVTFTARVHCIAKTEAGVGKTLTQKILEAHRVDGSLKAGEECALRVDHCLMQDATGTTALMEFLLIDPNAQVPEDIFAISYVDHNVLGVGPRNANDQAFLRHVCANRGIWFSPPMQGVSHQVHLERFAKPGMLMIGSDSHTPTAGAAGCLAIGVGGMDVAVVLAGEPFVMAAPAVVGVRLTGQLWNWASGKDVVLELLRRFTVKGGIGKVYEFFGPGVETLSVMDRAPIANMITELGATSAVFPADERVNDWLRLTLREYDFTPLVADDDAVYDEVIDVDLFSIEPMIACPSSPDNVVPVRDVGGTEVHQVCFGSSVNSWYQDLYVPAKIFNRCINGRRMAPPSDIEITVNPGSESIRFAAENSGVFRLFRLLPSVKMNWPSCGPCVGIGDSPAEGAVSVRTFNRNFLGRSGTPNDAVYLASPATAAACAVRGKITDPRDLGIGSPPIVPAPQYAFSRIFPIPPKLKQWRTADIPSFSTIRFPAKSDVLPDDLAGEILIVLGDNVATGTISPDGAKWMGMRSSFDEIAKGTFIGLDPDFTQEKDSSSFYERARAAGGGFIVAGENYGQGSSREHAAQSPMVLGVRAVLARSFARIHRRNLINHGIVPIRISRKLYNLARQGETWSMLKLRENIQSGKNLISVLTPDYPFVASLDLTPHERDVLLAGGLLNAVRAKRATRP